MEKNIILYVIFYLILTSFFIYIFVREKKINKIINFKIEKLAEKLSKKLRIENKTKKNILLKVLKITESFTTAIILVLIIQRFYLGNFMVPTGSMEKTIMPGDRLFGNMISYKFRDPKREEIIVFKEPLENKVLYTKRVMGLPGEKIKIKDNHLYINDKEITSREYTPLGDLGNEEWIIPKKGDILKIVPKINYGEAYKKINIDIKKIQEILKKDSSEVKQILPELEFYVNNEKTGMILDFIHDEKILNKLIKGQIVEIKLEDDYYLALGDNTNGSYDSRMWGFVKESRIRGRAFLRFWPITKIGILK
ncbi:signal peptidase I [Fusobacterium sp. MFO224]|uniref:signal peptidase I n=1 Tax=Fusobacterium sp. MFO224 TaxID=3378070 RepID=UPI003853105C